MSSVEVVVEDKRLLNDEQMLSEAIPGAEDTAFLSVKPVTCCSISTSGCDRMDFRVLEFPADATEIKDFAFQACSMLVSVTIPESVTVIGYAAFTRSSSLASVDIPNSVTHIGECAFQGCSSLASVIIPDSVTVIRNGAFQDCKSLTSVTIPISVTEMRAYASKVAAPLQVLPSPILSRR